MDDYDMYPAGQRNGHTHDYGLRNGNDAGNNLGTAAMASSSRPQSFIQGDDAAVFHPGANNASVGSSNYPASESGGATTATSATTTTVTLPERRNTLKKKASLRRSSSRRSMRAGSVRSLALHPSLDPDEMMSAFYCPVPTSGNPTDELANRFQCKQSVVTVQVLIC